MKTKRNLIPICLLVAVLLPALTAPAQVTVTQIAAGGQHTLFIKSDGSLWAMGYNYYGELGDGTTEGGSYQTNQPEMIVTNGVTAVAARGNHSFFQTGSSLWAMGDNAYGQLGNGTTNNIYLPQQITSVIAMAAGYDHTLFTRGFILSRDLDAMGDNVDGELGDGTYNNTNQPERIERDSTITFGDYYVTALAAGGAQSLLIKSDGSLWAMGYDGNGELGDGNGTDGIYWTNKTEKVVPSGVTAIAAGYEHSLFLKSGGSLWAMGDNSEGELGTTAVPTGDFNSFTNRPALIVAGNVTAIAGGFYDSFFIKSGGSLWAMGYNASGELGDGTYNSTNQPEQIVAAGVTAVSAGDEHSLFLESDGSLWGMGESFVGQLGAVSAIASYQPSPIQIIGPLVGNGSFESGDFLGWTRVGDFKYCGVNTLPSSAHSGTYGAQMGPVGALSSLAQTLNTIPGTNYLLSCWLYSDGDTPNEFKVSWNGVTLFDGVNLATTAWTNLQFVVAATGTNTALQFGFRDDPGSLGFDDVSVVPLSQPVLTGISVAGTNLVLSATNGLWNGTYLTLMSTNVAQPLSQWTPVATNLLDGSGPFTITATNAVNPAVPQRFYTLLLQ
jgi:alpha-tubulin suppressor-like RCC1 family protein